MNVLWRDGFRYKRALGLLVACSAALGFASVASARLPPIGCEAYAAGFSAGFAEAYREWFAEGYLIGFAAGWAAASSGREDAKNASDGAVFRWVPLEPEGRRDFAAGYDAGHRQGGAFGAWQGELAGFADGRALAASGKARGE